MAVVLNFQTEPYLMRIDESEAIPGEKYPPSDIPGKVYEGYCVDLANKIAELVQFEFKISVVRDDKYGSEDENGTWNGMIGELLRNVR